MDTFRGMLSRGMLRSARTKLGYYLTKQELLNNSLKDAKKKN